MDRAIESGLPVSVQAQQAAEERRRAYFAAHPRTQELPRVGHADDSCCLREGCPGHLPSVRLAPPSFWPTGLWQAHIRLAFAYCASRRTDDTDVIVRIGLMLLDQMPQLFPLCFDRVGHGYDVCGECGALVSSVAPTESRLALCSARLFPCSHSAARFTIVSKGRWACYIGVASRAADVEQPESFNGSHFFGLGSGAGTLYHDGQRIAWSGAERFSEGDCIDMLFDGRRGMLNVAKNSRVLGQVEGDVQEKLKAAAASDCEGAGLCWAVSASDVGWAVRVERIEPGAFGVGSSAVNDIQADDEDDIC